MPNSGKHRYTAYFVGVADSRRFEEEVTFYAINLSAAESRAENEKERLIERLAASACLLTGLKGNGINKMSVARRG